MKDTYKVIKARISASCKYICSYYELKVWFEKDDISNTIAHIYNIDDYEIKQKSGVKRGDGFKKIQAFLDTEEGKQWLGDYLYKQDYKKESDGIKDSIRVSMWKMNLDQLNEFDRLGREIRNAENKLIYPAVYKHFKGNYYAVMGVAEEKETDIEDLEKGYMKATHTENGERLTIEKTKDGEYIIVHYKNECNGQKFVLYKSLYDDSGIYARPIDMFLSEVDKAKYPDVNQKYRFELYRY